MACMTPEYWRAVAGIALKWRSSKIVQAVVAQLPENKKGPITGIPELLQLLIAGGINLHPMWLASEVQYARMQRIWSDRPNPPGYTEWLRRAALVEQAFRLQAAWVRAQIPGYPMLRVPHLVDGTIHTTPEYTTVLVWSKDHYLLKLQEQTDPPSADLQQEEIDLSGATRTFLDELRKTSTWERFIAARTALDHTAREQLKAANAGLRNALKPSAVDSFEATRAIRRDQYRREQLDRALEELDGPAREYAEAFGALNDLMNETFEFGIGYLAAFGKPRDIGAVRDLELPAVDEVSFLHDDYLRTGGLFYVPDGLVADVVMIDSVTVNVHDDVETLRYHGRILRGTKAGWDL